VGIPIDREDFTDEDRARFEGKLLAGLRALRTLLARPGFGEGPPSLGAELEGSVVGPDARPRLVNEQVLGDLDDPQTQLELVRFNLEYNLTPHPTAGRSLRLLEDKLDRAVSVLDGGCRRHGGRFIPVGILPTLTQEDLGRDILTPQPRYRALVKGIEGLRNAPIEIDIHGPHDHLRTHTDAIAVEGSNTSFQLHLRVPPERYADTYDAAQLVTPLALGVHANSPIFLGRALWDETRVPLFKQALHARTPIPVEWRRVARVPFGHGWVREGVWELFAESVALFAAICPVTGDEDPEAVVAAGGIPQLAELRLHHGTIWQWNRAVYDAADGGHLRVELRALPSGPTPVDLTATSAFLAGLVVGMRDEMHWVRPSFPFQYAEYNFYRAAQRGLDARVLWPTRRPVSPVERNLKELCRELLPVAEAGLAELGVDADDVARYLGVVRERLRAETTGARWLRRGLDRYEGSRSRTDALAALTNDYVDRVTSRQPVHEWAG